MTTEDAEILQEFLIESSDNLTRLDQEMVMLEQHPDRQDLLAGIFRTIHTIKGTCGFLGFTRLQALAHVTEDILNEMRQNRRRLDGPLTSLILHAVDAIKRILSSIEAGAGEGEVFETGLISQLQRVWECAPTFQLQTEAARLPAPIQEEPGAAPSQASENSAADPTGNHDAADPPGVGACQTSGISHAALRVDVGLLDRLMNLVGELVLTRNQILQHDSALEDTAFNPISQRLSLITTELQQGIMKTRMQPIGLVWNSLPRIVRDLATGLGKEIGLEMEGAETGLDRTLIDAIRDPLTHIVRNCCDHGIESPQRRIECGKPPRGRLSLRAYHEGGQVNIEIADDGAGIDPDRVKAKAIERRLIGVEQAARLSAREILNLVFLPGFSTAASVTSVSGRGVGMDVVKTNIEQIGGTVDLLSEPGQGTTIRMRIPLTLAIVPGLVVGAGGERFVIPQASVHELVRLEGDDTRLVEHVHSTAVFRRRNALLPLANLCEILKLSSESPPDEISIVVLDADEHRFALIVDRIGDSQEIVVKPAGRQLKGLACYAGATIMGDGRISLILDVMGLGVLSKVIAAGHSTRGAPAVEPPSGREPGRRPLLLCRAGSFERLAIPLPQVARLEKTPSADVERASGRAAIQYRGRILPLVDVAEMLGGDGAHAEDLYVVVYRSGACEFGLVVDEISDIVNETIGEPCPSHHAGLLGSAVVGGRVTDFLDVEAIARMGAVSSSDGIERLRAAILEGGCDRQWVGVQA